MRRISVLALTLVVLALGARASNAQPIGPFSITAQDVSGTCATASACVDFDIGNGTAQALTIDISGTWTGTLTFYASVAGSSGTFRIITVTNVTDLSTTQTTTAAGAWTVSNVGYGIVRVRATAAMTGSAAVSARRGFLNARMSNTPSFTVGKFGDGTAAAPSVTFANETNLGLYRTIGGGQLGLVSQGAGVLGLNGSGQVLLASGVSLGWEPSGLFIAAADTILARDAANAIAQRNGTNAQAFNVYRTTNGTDKEYLSAAADLSAAGSFDLITRQAGAGALRRLTLGSGSAQWVVTATTGNFTGITATAGLGYGAGAGGTVTQATSKATGVTLNTVTGQITLNAAALAAATIVSFTLTDSAIAATDLLLVQHQAGGTLGAYTINAAAAAGSATIYIRNNTAGSLAEAIVISFAVIKGATS